MNYDSLQHLIGYWGQFVQDTGSSDLHEFAHWLTGYLKAKKENGVAESEETTTEDVDYLGTAPLSLDELAYMYPKYVPLDCGIYILFIRMHRFLRIYFKAVMEEVSELSFDEFGILIATHMMGETSKSEIIAASLLEFTTGAEIINRLVRMKLCTEHPHELDKRVKMVRLTEEGRELLGRMMARAPLAHRLMTFPLSETEQRELAPLLHKLNEQQSKLYFSNPRASLAELIRKTGVDADLSMLPTYEPFDRSPNKKGSSEE